MSGEAAGAAELADLFERATALDRDGRARMLADLAVADAATAQALRELLSHDEAASDDFLAGHVRRAARAVVRDLGDAAIASAADLSGSSIGDHVLLERLGRGGAGVVYRAEAPDGRIVALKLLGERFTGDLSAVRRFRREFRAVSRLFHPACLRVESEGEDDGRHFYTMEYVAGGDLDGAAMASGAEAVAVLVQLASGLDHVHLRGLVHRDLKPSNVLLAPGEPRRPLLADFGLARAESDDTALTASNAIVGTVDYLAPEQVLGEPIDPRTDLYAFGCLVYRLWSGAPAFGGTVFERLRARVEREPPPLAQVAPEAPARLGDLVGRLMAREPERRPSSALEVQHELQSLLGELDPDLARAVAARLPEPDSSLVLYRPPCVGRDALIGRLLDAAASGTPRAACVVAEAGMGKSTLVAALARRLPDGRSGLLGVAPDVSGASPRAAVDALVRALASGPGGDALRAAFSGGRDEAAPTDVRWLPGDDADARLRTQADALAGAITRTTGLRALVFEDVHAMDATTLRLFAAVVARLAARAAGPLVLATSRPEGEAAVERLLEGAASRERLDLQPLGAAAVVDAAAASLGGRPEALPEGLADYLVAASRGIPLWAQSALRALVDGGVLRRSGAGWEVDDLTPPAPSDGADVIGRRLGGWDDASRAILEAAAVLGESFDIEALAAVAGRAEEAVLDVIDAAVRRQVVARGRPGAPLAFEHQRLVEVLYDGLPDARRRALHDAAGAVFQARSGAPAAQVAHHLGRGGDPPRAIPHLIAAAGEALDRADHGAVARHLTEALELGADPAEGDLAERRADALLAVGRAQEAAEVLAGLVAAGADDRVAEGRCRRKRGQALLLSSDTAEGVAELRRALATLGYRVPKTRLGALLVGTRDWFAASLRRRWGRPKPSEAWRERALAHRELGLLLRWVDLERSVLHGTGFLRAAERTGDPRLRLTSYTGHAAALTFAGFAKTAARLDAQARELAEATGYTSGLAHADILRGGTILMTGTDTAGARAQLDAAVEGATRAGDRFLTQFALASRGWARTVFGDFAAAREDFEAALAFTDAVDLQWMRADATCGLGLVELVTGRTDRAGELVRSVIEDERLGLPALTAVATEVAGGIDLAEGRPEAALGHLDEARRMYFSHHLERGWGFLVHAQHTEALLLHLAEAGVDAVPDAGARLRQNAKLAARQLRGAPLFGGFDHVLKGIAASRAGRRKAAERSFERARQVREPLEHNYMDAWMNARVAVERLRLGAPRAEAVATLDASEAVLERHGMRGWQSWLQQLRALYGL